MTAPTDNAARVLQALQRTTSARRIDLMHTCHMTRGEVHEALDELKRAGLVNSITSGARYIARASICPPAATPAHTSDLANDTRQAEQRSCAGGLGAVGHTGERA